MGEELLSELQFLVGLDDDGNLAPWSREAIRDALARAERRIGGQPQDSADMAARQQTERMRPAALAVFDEQIAGLTGDAQERAEIHDKADLADTAQAHSVMLVRNLELMDSIKTEAIAKYEKHLIAALEKRGTPEQRVARALIAAEEVSQMTRGRANRIAAWDSDTMNTEYAADFNFANEIGSYLWRTQEDSDVRPTHQLRNGDVFRWDSPPDDGDPGVPPGCRCEAIPVLPSQA